jgi:hypothetical protein
LALPRYWLPLAQARAATPGWMLAMVYDRNKNPRLYPQDHGRFPDCFARQ